MSENLACCQTESGDNLPCYLIVINIPVFTYLFLNITIVFLETYLLACLVDYFSNHEDYIKLKEGVKQADLYMSWKSIHQDVRKAVDWVHIKVRVKFKYNSI